MQRVSVCVHVHVCVCVCVGVLSVATIIAIHDILRYIHHIGIQKQCSSCCDVGLISADMLTIFLFENPEQQLANHVCMYLTCLL